MSHLLQTFAIYPTPQPHMQRGSNLTLRCLYYEPFLINIASFGTSSCLLCVLQCAFGAQLASLRLRSRSIQLAVFLALSVPFQLCILDYPFANYANFLLPYSAVGCALALAAFLRRFCADRSAGLRHAINRVAAASRTLDAFYLVDENWSFNAVLSAHRSALYICTLLCIFSRDLPCWNNRFSKSKTFGTGLMDMGIGCFVICLGSAGPTAVRPCKLVDRSRAIKRCARQSSILAGLGLCISLQRAWIYNRFLANRAHAKATDPDLLKMPLPPPHLRFSAEWWEYGIHWSAFYSLAIARAFGTALELCLLRRRWSPLLTALTLSALHETLLANGLAKFVFAPGILEPYNRHTLIGQNREGLASIPGLLALYFAGVQLGRWVREWTSDARYDWRLSPTHPALRILALLMASLLVRPLAVVETQLVMPESRRLINSAYCAWVVAISCASLLVTGWLLALRNCLSVRSSANQLFQVRYLAAFDRAGFASFLLSNLATGLFNAVLEAAAINRESFIGSGKLCFAVVMTYSVIVQLIALKLASAASGLPSSTRRLNALRTL